VVLYILSVVFTEIINAPPAKELTSIFWLRLPLSSTWKDFIYTVCPNISLMVTKLAINYKEINIVRIKKDKNAAKKIRILLGFIR
jgi:hypothetical protein